jgi:hypothetical protein
MSVLSDVTGQFAPSNSDLSGAKSGLALAVQYPGLAQTLSENDALLSTLLTGSNLIGGAKDPTKSYIGIIFIFGFIAVVGFFIGRFTK